MALFGLVAIAGGLFNWDWFMNARKVQMVAKLLGRGGARVFYCLLGSAIVVLGLLMAFGVIASKTR